jgi:hypothetical protein
MVAIREGGGAPRVVSSQVFIDELLERCKS